MYILVSAELIGIVYYRALEAATDCQRLKPLCRGLVSDELAHMDLNRNCCSRCARGPARSSAGPQCAWLIEHSSQAPPASYG